MTLNIWKVAVSLSFLKKLIKSPINNLYRNTYCYSNYEDKNKISFQRSGGTFLGKIMNDKAFKYQKKGNLNDYLNEYLSKLEKGSYSLLDYIQICKSIANYYTKEKHQQFIRQRMELQKMIDTFISLQTGEPSLQDYQVLMDFLKIMENIQPINKKITNTLKDILFSKIGPIIQKLDDVKFQDLLKLYCTISLLNSPQTQRIGKFLHERIQKKYLNQERITTAVQAEKILKSFGQRKFLYHFDNTIIQLLLMDLKGSIQPNDKLLILKIADAINSCDIIGNKADWQFVSIVKQIINKATQIIQERYNPQFVDYFLQKNCSSGNALSIIYQTIYKYFLEKIAIGDKNPKLLKQFCSVLQKRKNNLYSIEDIKIVISYIRTSFENSAIKSIVFKQQSMEFIIIEMMQSGFFDADMTLLNEIIILPKVEIYWNFVVQYSMRNVPFPIDLLAKKIKQKTGLFSKDNNYMKIAVSIYCQHKLHPTNQLLSKSYQNVFHSIKSQKWSNQHWTWLLKQSVINMKLSKKYFQQFSEALLMHFNTNNQTTNFCRQKDNNSISPFWIYFLTVAELNQKNELLLNNMPIETIQVVSFRQSSKPNRETIINTLLLKAIIINIKSHQLNLQKLKTKGMLFLLKIYSQQILYERELTIELYLNVVTQLVLFLPKIPTQIQIYVKAIILKSTNIQSYIIYNSIYYRTFVSQTLKQLEHISKGLYQRDLAVSVIRRGLQHKLVTAENLISINIEDSYFTELEKNILKALNNQYKNQSASYSSLIAYLVQAKRQQKSIETLNKFYQIIESCSLRALQRLILYYPSLDKRKNDLLFIKICQKLVQKFQIGKIDIVGVLKSILHQNIDMEPKFFQIITRKLSLEPWSLFLRDHLEVIKLLKRRKIIYPEYYQSLLNQFVRKSEQNLTIFDIAIELKSQGTAFSKQLMELMKQIAYKNNKYEMKLKKLQP